MLIKEMSEPPAQAGTFLLHCRPQTVFHLGHLRMLNVLGSLLEAGRKVVILIITYDEHDPSNRTIKRRLAEDVELTASFYRAYLGVDGPQLQIVPLASLDNGPEELARIQRAYAGLYAEGNPEVTYLVDRHGKSWASPNVLFVPKCIAGIERIAPDALIAGMKHEPIAAAFDSILAREGREIPSFLFPNLLDLRMVAGMDHTRSVQHYIDISEHEDLILHKLNLLRDDPAVRASWLDHFMELAWRPAPARLKAGISAVHPLESAKVLTITKFLANVRGLVPYATHAADDVTVTWSDDLAMHIESAERTRVARLVADVYSDSPYAAVTLYKVMKGGKSGSTVYGVREFEDKSAASISHLSVLKAGRSEEIVTEAANYTRLIAPKRTAGFMAVRSTGRAINGSSALVYEDAGHFLGVDPSLGLEPIGAVFSSEAWPPVDRRRALDELLTRHLYEVLYRHGTRRDVTQIRRCANEFLPAEYRITLGADGTGPVNRPFLAGVTVTERDPRPGVAFRAYTAGNTKIDILEEGSDRAALTRLHVGHGPVDIQGRITQTRDAWLRDAILGIGLLPCGDRLQVAPGLVIPDPVAGLSGLLSREYRDVTESAVHGDLHAENVLWSSGRFGIIDYGEMRTGWPALYDVAFLFADLKCRIASARMSLHEVDAVERSLASNGVIRLARGKRGLRELFELFEYRSQRPEITGLGPPDLFYALMAIVLLGRLKFDLSTYEKQVCVVLANAAMRRVR